MLREHANRLVVLLPAYRPNDSLLDFVRALSAQSLRHIVIVDDGSGPEFRDVFIRASELPGVEILRHAANLGKGAAIKTGVNHALCNCSDLIGVITCDEGDRPDEVARAAESLLA